MQVHAASPSPVLLESRGATHPGQRRQDNEDVYGLYPNSRLFVLADGMGGAAGGAMAARLSVDELVRFFRTQGRSPRTPWPHPLERRQTLGANLLRVGMKVANQQVRAAQKTSGMTQMGATIAALAVGDAQVSVAHVGDVRAYRLRDGELGLLTRDHTVREEVRALQPDITEAELAQIPQRDLVTRVIGMGDEVEPTVTAAELRRGDLFLLCCDGLWGPVAEQTIADVLIGTPDLGEAAETLIAAANEAGGPDNVTVVLVRAV